MNGIRAIVARGVVEEAHTSLGTDYGFDGYYWVLN